MIGRNMKRFGLAFEKRFKDRVLFFEKTILNQGKLITQGVSNITQAISLNYFMFGDNKGIGRKRKVNHGSVRSNSIDRGEGGTASPVAPSLPLLNTKPIYTEDFLSLSVEP
jgi:hypothetical protein